MNVYQGFVIFVGAGMLIGAIIGLAVYLLRPVPVRLDTQSDFNWIDEPPRAITAEEWRALFLNARRVFGLPILPYDDSQDVRTSGWEFFAACQRISR